MKGQTIIVAGSRGLIGQHVCDTLQCIGTFEGQRYRWSSAGSVEHRVIELDVKLGHDLTDECFVKQFFAENNADALINLFAFNDHVAPGEKRGTLFDLPLQSFRDCMETNLTALFSVCREFARNNKSGSIINFGASTGLVSARPDMYGGAHKHVGYSVSKAGVIHLTRILAAHLAPDVRVNCISPGGIESDQPEEFKELYGSHTPMGRMGRLDDLMPAIMMLLDPQNAYMTGANITIDGGWTLI